MDYKSSGVDVQAGREFIERIRSCVEGTHRPEVLGGLGGFGGFMRLPEGLQKPVLVAGADGVGTKLELAQAYNLHASVGIDLVAMCVNDVITSGAKPLFFLDYIATGLLSPESMTQVIEGIAAGCNECGCSLLGGETAEMPGFYEKGRYDLAGFCVAVVEEELLITGKNVVANDRIIGIASSGVHSNGFSLVRKVLGMANADINTCFGTSNSPLISSLMKPTNIYAQAVESLLKANISIHGMAHITGGGLPENLPRCLPSGLTALIDPASWTRPELFQWLKDIGQIPENDLWNTFNLGIGFCLVVNEESVNQTIAVCGEAGFKAWQIGQVIEASNDSQEALQGIPS